LNAPSSDDVTYTARWVLPIAAPPIEHAAVSVTGGRITYVGPASEAPVSEVVALGDVALLPGLVNTHTHLELTAMRGFLEDLDFVTWIRTLTRARAEVLDDESLLDASRLGVAEGIAAGITTYADTSASGAPMQALVEAGVRGIVYQEVFGPAPEQRESAFAGLRDAVARLREIETPLVRVGVSPHAVFTVHEDLLLDASAWAVRERLPVAMHVSESEAELQFIREGSGPFAENLRGRGITVVRRAHSPVHLLVELGIAAVAHPLLIHGVRFDASDVHLAALHACPVAHCPASNAKLGHGVAPLVEMLDAGVTVGLGSDSVASNNRMDILDEARHAVLAQRARVGRHDALSAAAALELATLGGARALGIGDRVGSLEVGKDADLAAFSLAGPRGVGAGSIESTLLFSVAGHPATFVAVAGRPLVRDGQPIASDEALRTRVGATTERLRAWNVARLADA
jgi:cytosine/adenosine deaminase-related metal-dependent hydrolase